MKPIEGRKRVVIEEVSPQVDGGRYPAKRTLDDVVNVTAAVFGDGHDHVSGRLLYRHSSKDEWRSIPLVPLTNDLCSATFVADELGDWLFTIEGWVDHFDTWSSDLQKRIDAQPVAGSQDVALAFRSGALLLEQIAQRAAGSDSKLLSETAAKLQKLAKSK